MLINVNDASQNNNNVTRRTHTSAKGKSYPDSDHVFCVFNVLILSETFFNICG